MEQVKSSHVMVPPVCVLSTPSPPHPARLPWGCPHFTTLHFTSLRFYVKRNPVSVLLSPARGPCSSSSAPGPCSSSPAPAPTSSLHQPLGPAPPHQPLGPAPPHQPLGPTPLISPLLLTRPDIPPCLPNAAVTLPNAAGAPRALLVRGVREAQRTPHRTPHPPRDPWDTPWDPLAVTLCTRGPSEHTPGTPSSTTGPLWDPLLTGTSACLAL